MNLEDPAAPDRTSVVFKGRSGDRFYFQVWPLSTKFRPVGGVYIVTRRSFQDSTFTTRATHQPLVIGHTANLADALISRSQRAKLTTEGANCICVCAVADAARRVEIEKDLIDGNEDFRGQLQSLYYLSEPTSPPVEPPGAR